MRVRRLLLAAVAAASFVVVQNSAASAQNSCIQLYSQYQDGPAPKAWARATNGPCGYATARSASSVSQAKNLALGYCKSSGGVGCRVISSQGK